MSRFRSCWLNILYLRPEVRWKLGQSVRLSLAGRKGRGLAVGAPRVGEVCDGERRHGKGRWVVPSTRRYVGLDSEGALALKMRLEGATLKDISAATGWPISTVWQFLERRKKEGLLN